MGTRLGAVALALTLAAAGASAEPSSAAAPSSSSAPSSLGATPDYVAVPAGKLNTVLSGSSAGNLPVRVERFALRRTPVTNREFAAFAARNPEWQRSQAPALFVEADYLRQLDGLDLAGPRGAEPVTNVSWFAAQAYCESEGARLPTWYEWEYVGAADERRADARKDPAWRARILNWYSHTSDGGHDAVGGKENYYHVRDMHGLIWEWVDDFNALLISGDSRSQGDPEKLQYCGAGAISLQDRDNFAILMRVALLSSLKGASSTNDLGFRCARSLNKEHP